MDVPYVARGQEARSDLHINAPFLFHILTQSAPLQELIILILLLESPDTFASGR